MISKRCLGIIVVYDLNRATSALKKFRELIAVSFEEFSIIVVTNNPDVDGDLRGSNICAEFSGWAEGLSNCDYETYDVVILANDTIARKQFGYKEKRIFLTKVSQALDKKRLFLVGGMHWHINYSLLSRKKRFLLKWVQTNLFAISPEALTEIGGISLTEKDISTMLGVDQNGNFVLYNSLQEVVRWRVQDWLNPSSPEFGWHSSFQVSKSVKRLKAKCVLQELDLTRRCYTARVSIYSTATVRKRDYILSLIYFFQERFPNYLKLYK